MTAFGSRLASTFRRYKKDCAGSSTMISILASIPVAVTAGAAIDYTRATSVETHLQIIVDGAALAAGAAKNPHGDTNKKKFDTRRTLAMNYLDKYLPSVKDVELLGTPTIDVGPNTVDVTLQARVKGSLLNMANAMHKDSALIGSGSGGDQASHGKSHNFDMTVTSKIGYLKESYVCLLALDPTRKEAIYFQGNSEFTAACSVQANSDDAVAIKTWGNAYAEADSFCAVGGWSGSGFYPDPVGGCKRRLDPYASLALPTTDGHCDYSNFTVKNDTVALTPGTYCGGLSVVTHGEADLAPGLYIIKDGELAVDGQSILNAPSGVVFYLTGDASVVDINSGATVTIVAPNKSTAGETTANYAGFAILQDRTTGAGNVNTISSKGGVNITGGIYTPNQDLMIWANGDMNTDSKYFPMIVNSLEMNGTATLFVNLDYAAANLEEPVRLKAPAKVFVSR